MKFSFKNAHHKEPSFPTNWLTLVVFFEMLMIGLSVWMIGYTEKQVREGMKRQVRLERLHGDIVYLDEVLTMSAKMGSTSGEPKWEARYKRNEKLLDEKIQEVFAEAQTLDLDLNELGISTTNEANVELVEMEQLAFNKVNEGNLADAYALLSSEKYIKNKELYAAGLEKLLNRLDFFIGTLVEDQKRQVKTAQIFAIIGWILLISVWVGVIQSIQKWKKTLLSTQRELSTYQTHLEERVFAMAKEMTRAEHRERQRIANLLHDQLQQVLVAARLQVGLMPESSYRTQINDLLEESIKLSRSLTHELNPPALMLRSFGSALEWVVDWVKQKHALNVEHTIQEELPQIETEVKIIAFDAIREFLFNVVKHAQVTTAKLSASVSQQGNLLIIIEDNGVGFDTRQLASGNAFGLLNIIRRLELIGGSLEIKSKPGQGCKITIVLPSDQQPENPTKTNDTAQDNKTIKVLLVDDHPIVRAGLVSLLKRFPDIELLEASGMKEVQEYAPAFSPDVAIVDISLGEGLPDGESVTIFLKEQYKDIKIIAFTSYSDPMNKQRMMQAGAEHYLIKGCSNKDLLDAVRA